MVREATPDFCGTRTSHLHAENRVQQIHALIIALSFTSLLSIYSEGMNGKSE